jgi:putative SOS response-associated peptidase YedK
MGQAQAAISLRPKSGEPFAMAGIYAPGENEGDPMTFAILTTEANDVMRPIRTHPVKATG